MQRTARAQFVRHARSVCGERRPRELLIAAARQCLQFSHHHQQQDVMQRRLAHPLLRPVAGPSRWTVLVQTECRPAPPRAACVAAKVHASRPFSTSLARCNSKVEDDQPQSFSDTHFGQERDREEKRRRRRDAMAADAEQAPSADEDQGMYSEADHEHAVISTFDLFSIGIGPSSSHTVGPMRAGKIFVTDLIEASLLSRVSKIRISLYGSLAATGEGHMTPSALLLGLESANVETVETAYVPERFEEIKTSKRLHLAKGADEEAAQGGREIDFDFEKDLVWEWGKTLPMHSNGMRLTVFDEEGTMLATNDMFSVGGGFVVNGALSTAPSTKSSPHHANTELVEQDDIAGHPADLTENMYYKQIRRSDATAHRRSGAEIRPTVGEQGALPEPSLEGQQPLVPGDASSASSAEPVSSSKATGPRFPFRDGRSLLRLCKEHNLTIAQLVYDNERSLGYSDDEIRYKLFLLWDVMDKSIREGVSSKEDVLPGSLKLNRRAPGLYRRLTRGLYPSQGMDGPTLTPPPRPHPSLAQGGHGDGSSSTSSASATGLSLAMQSPTHGTSLRSRGPPRVHGSFNHPIVPSPPRRTTFPAIDYLSVYAMAVNEVNAAGGRIVTAPTNGAAGVIPAVLKYTLEFQSDDAERDVFTFLLTAAAIGMLFKRGATISAAAGGCMAEVGVACSMAAGGFAACMGASPEVIESAAEIGIEHNLGLTCDPIGGLVQAPCIERNALGAVKAIASANLALSSSGTPKVSLDDAIRAMRLTALGMRNEFKETSLSGLATSVSFKIPVSEPDC